MKTTFVLSIENALATLKLVSEPAGKPPALDYDSLQSLEDCLKILENPQSGVRMLRLESASEKYFCVGANINALAELNASNIGEWVRRGHLLFNRLALLPFPTLCCVRGAAMGGGLELALCCDTIFADTSAQFALPEARIGVVPGWGGTVRLRERIGATRALTWMNRGAPVNAHKALAQGLLDELFEDSIALENGAAAYAADVLACSAQSLREIKQMINFSRERDWQTAREQEDESSVRVMRGEEAPARIAAFLSKRKK